MIAQTITKTERRIVNAIPKCSEWFTTLDLSLAAGVARKTTWTYMHKLVADGRLIKGPRVVVSSTAFFFTYRAVSDFAMSIGIPEPPPPRNLFEAIIAVGHDEDWIPKHDERFIATGAEPGSEDKIEVLRRRVELGHPLWHKDDRVDYRGLVGSVQPKE